MKVLVAYYSKTGNTEKVARAICDALPGTGTIAPIKDLETAEGYDLVFCGFPVQAHSVPAQAQPFLKGLDKGQKVAFFSTHGSLRGGTLPKQAFENAISLAGHTVTLGHFGCRGKVEPDIIDMLKQKDEHRAWAEEALSADGHPDQADLEDAKAWVKNMVAKA